MKMNNLVRYYDGYVVGPKGIGDSELKLISRDFRDLSDELGKSQLQSWVEGEPRIVTEARVLEFATDEIRRKVNFRRKLDGVVYAVPLSEGVRKLNWREDWEFEWERKLRTWSVETYEGFDRATWVAMKNALQRLIAHDEGHLLDPSREETRGFDAMYGVMARAVWNAARCDHGRQLCIPSAQEIAREAERIIQRWKMRGMI